MLMTMDTQAMKSDDCLPFTLPLITSSDLYR